METIDMPHLEALARKAQGGDAEAFGEIFMLLSDPIYRYAYFRTGSEEEARDIVSETFKRVWSYIRTYRQDNFRAYVYRIAHNLVCDYYKRKRRNVPLEGMEESGDGDPVSDNAEKLDDIERMKRAMETLPEAYYAIVNLRFIEGYSVRETAGITGKSEITVRVTQNRALAKLKKILV